MEFLSWSGRRKDALFESGFGKPDRPLLVFRILAHCEIKSATSFERGSGVNKKQQTRGDILSVFKGSQNLIALLNGGVEMGYTSNKAINRFKEMLSLRF